MVWLHGGGFINGSGNAFNGAYFARTANAIVVTVNYRLGPFGWLALPSLAKEAKDGSTGDYGLLDDIAALKWVQRNIASFGDDPARVALFGQSAGGESTFALMASPYAKGLFQRAISMSAPATLRLPSVEQAAARRDKFLAALHCTDSATQLDCLRQASAQQLLDAAHPSWDLIKVSLQWTPTVDGAVLPDQWLTLFKEGQFNKVPAMIGHTKEEGRFFVAIAENAQGRPMSTEQVDEAIHKTFGPAANPILTTYPAGAFAGPGDRFAQIVVDGLFAAGEERDRLALAEHVPVFAYQSCDPRAPESHVQAKFSRMGCAHDSDLTYLFQWDDFTGEPPNFTDEQKALAIQIGRYWGNFAATGNPNGANLLDWPAYRANSAPVQLLEPASSGGVRTSPTEAYQAEHKLRFWESLK